jgi:Flp pilus assembly protein TadG
MSKLQVWSKKFQKNEDGAIAMIFGLSIIVIFMCAGMGMDFARAHQASTKAANAIDTATLAAAKAMREDSSLSDAQLLTIAQQYFDANIPNAGRGLTTWNAVTFPVAPNRETGTVKASVTGVVGTYFARVAGPSFEQIPLTKTSTVNFSLKDIEFGLALDVTGSMCEDGPAAPCTTGPKIGALKSAAKDLVDILMPDGGTPGRKVRIGLAPYAPTVRLPATLATLVTNGASTNGCVVERQGPAAYDDDSVGPTRWISAAPSGAFCINAPNTIMPLSEQTQKAALKAKIDGLLADKGTAGHIGLAWAWYMISPDWQGTWNLPVPAAPYKDPKTIKAVLLMTDGKFNTSYYNGASSDTQARNLCTAMKNGATHDLIVYTIGFKLNDPAAKKLLEDCASTPGAPHFFDAKNEAELRKAFKDIATNLNNLRLTQ